VQKALESLPWAKQVQIDFANRQATFRADPAQYDENAIVRALDEAGFAGSKVLK
jgi:copper chaperone CopZ